MEDNLLYSKCKAFAIRVVRLYQFLCDEKREFVMSKQLLRCGTSIGANVSESRNAQSRADFVNKLSIALKEADETCYWLELLAATDFMTQQQFDSVYSDAKELVKMLVSIVKTAKSNPQDDNPSA